MWGNSSVLQGCTVRGTSQRVTIRGRVIWREAWEVGFGRSFGHNRFNRSRHRCGYNGVGTTISFVNRDTVHITVCGSNYRVLPAFAIGPNGRFVLNNESGLSATSFTPNDPGILRASSISSFALSYKMATRLSLRGFLLGCSTPSNEIVFRSHTPLTCGFRNRFNRRACRCVSHRGNRRVCKLNSGDNELGGTNGTCHVRASSDVNCGTRASSPLCGRIPFCVYRGSTKYCKVCCSADSTSFISLKHRVGGCCRPFGFFGAGSSYLICCVFFNAGLSILRRCTELYNERTFPPG